MVVVDWVGNVAVGAVVDGGIVVIVTVVGIVIVDVIVDVDPVVVVVVMVTVVVGLTFGPAAASFEEPEVTCASPTPATAANARPTADATTTVERRLTRGNRLGIWAPFVGDFGLRVRSCRRRPKLAPRPARRDQRLGSRVNRRDDRSAVALEEQVDHSFGAGQADAPPQDPKQPLLAEPLSTANRTTRRTASGTRPPGPNCHAE